MSRDQPNLISRQQARELVDPNAADWAPEAFKAASSLLPVVGGLVAYAIDRLPARRLDRVARFLHLLADQVDGMQAEIGELRAQWEQRPEASGLLEAGLAAAAGTPTNSRLERLARVVAAGLTTGEIEAMSAARRIRLIQEVDDGEFTVLCVVERERRITLRYEADYAWIEDSTLTFLSDEGVHEPPPLPSELADWSLGDLSTALNHLAGLGLIEANIAQHSKEYGEHRSYVATPAGAALVRIVVEAQSRRTTR